jgi:osmotically inducible protein OsmC
MTIVKTATAHWEGDLKTGKGQISTESGALKSNPYGFNTRFEGQPGTNPEELIGAAHAGCFSMALSNILGEGGMKADSIDTKASVTLEKLESGFTITKIHLESTIKVSGADKAKVEEAAKKAKENCPVSKVLKAAEITLATTISV